MARQSDNSSTIIVVVVAIIIAIIIVAFVYAKTRVSIAKAEHSDKDVELAKIQAMKESRKDYYDAEKERAKTKTEVLNKAIDNVGSVANTVATKGMDMAADMLKDEESGSFGLETPTLEETSENETIETTGGFRLRGGARRIYKKY